MISNMLWAQMHFYELSWSYEIIDLNRLRYESMLCKKHIIWVKFKVKQRIVYSSPQETSVRNVKENVIVLLVGY